MAAAVAEREYARKCAVCRTTVVMTPFSSVTCDSCTAAKEHHCGGCGRTVGSAGAPATPPRAGGAGPAGGGDGDRAVEAFRRTWHARCLELFHPDYLAGANDRGLMHGSSGGGGGGGAGALSGPLAGGVASPDRASGAASGAAGSPRTSADAPARRGSDDGSDWGYYGDGSGSGNLTFVFNPSPVPRTPMGDMIGPDGRPVTEEDNEDDAMDGSSGAGGRSRGKRSTSIMGDGDVLLRIVAAIKDHPSLVAARTYNFTRYQNCVVGNELVQWMVKEFPDEVPNPLSAMDIGQQLIARGILEHVTRDHDFKNERLFYYFRPPSSHVLAAAHMRATSASAASMPPMTKVSSKLAALTGESGVVPHAGGAMDARMVPAGTPVDMSRAASSVDQRTLELGARLVIDGFMYKQGHTIRNWKMRWFVLKGCTLSYFKRPEDRRAKGSVDIREYTLIKGDGPKSMSLLKRDGSTRLNLRAQSELEVSKWVTCISQTMQQWQDALAPVVAP